MQSSKKLAQLILLGSQEGPLCNHHLGLLLEIVFSDVVLDGQLKCLTDLDHKELLVRHQMTEAVAAVVFAVNVAGDEFDELAAVVLAAFFAVVIVDESVDGFVVAAVTAVVPQREMILEGLNAEMMQFVCELSQQSVQQTAVISR